jgi:hypothetical protein
LIPAVLIFTKEESGDFFSVGKRCDATASTRIIRRNVGTDFLKYLIMTSFSLPDNFHAKPTTSSTSEGRFSLSAVIFQLSFGFYLQSKCKFLFTV